MAWTRRDEERLTAAREAIGSLEEARLEAVANVARALRSAGVEGFDAYAVIRDADAIRDALAPFDSGVRLGAVE